MKYKTKVTCEDKELKAMIRRLKSLEQYTVEGGYYDDPHPKHGESMAYIALQNEEGGITSEGYEIPSRPFIYTASSLSDYYQLGMLDDLTRHYILEGGNIRSSLAQFGENMTSMITESIEIGTWEDNAPVTIKKKGRNEPLVDSGYMKDHPKWKIVKDSGED